MKRYTITLLFKDGRALEIESDSFPIWTGDGEDGTVIIGADTYENVEDWDVLDTWHEWPEMS